MNGLPENLAARARSLWRTLSHRAQRDAEIDEEMRYHVEMHAERLARRHGSDPGEAQRQARVDFGGFEKYKEETRDARGIGWVDAVALDARLGVRMLIKHRGLTLVGGFAMAVAIAVGATYFEVISEVLDPTLPFEDGKRVVALQYSTSNLSRPERRMLHDFANWRHGLVSVVQLGAFRTTYQNLTTSGAVSEPVRGAEITATGFTVTRTPPLLGRHLLTADERGEPVVVIGYQTWQSRFGGDARIVGRKIDLGGIPHTVVGVMPDGFKFPIDHQFWTPLRENPVEYGRLQGPEVYLFGRLAPGFTLEAAQSELTAAALRNDSPHSDASGRIRPVVLPYTRAHLDITHPQIVWLLKTSQFLVGALSFIVAINLAILLYARTVTRLGEIAVRTALGATRRRILAQLFVEALALSIVGAAIGLVLAFVTLGRLRSLAPTNGSVPFWFRFDLSAETVTYAFGLAVLAAIVMGVLPGLKATGSRMAANMRELNSRTATPLGSVWQTLVIAQIAVAVAILPVAVFTAWRGVQMELTGPGFAAERLVVGTVAVGSEHAAADSTRIRARQLELISRLEKERGVSAVTFSSSIPGFAPDRRIEFERAMGARVVEPGYVSTLAVAVELFDIYGVPIIGGRAFDSADIGPSNAVIVNRTFMLRFFNDRPGLGLRFRYSPAQGQTSTGGNQWYQIVGIVADFPRVSPDGSGPTVYHPMARGDGPVTLSVRFSGGTPAQFIERFRKIAAEVDPALPLRRVMPLSQLIEDQRSLWRYVAWAIAWVTTSVVLLSAAGIYAMMSFSVTQRTREIGIRSALGASPHRLLASIFGRASRQLAAGISAGVLASGAAMWSSGVSGRVALILLLTVAGLMSGIALLAAVGPARRGLRMHASDALRTEG